MAVICGTPAPVTTRVVQIEPGPMPTLMASAPARASSQAPSKVATLPAISSTSGSFDFTSLTASRTLVECPWALSMASTSTFAFGQFLRALQKISGGADGRAHAQPALRIFRGVGIFQLLLNVFDRDQALQVVLVVDDQKFLDAMLVQNFFRFFERGADGNGDEVFLGHHFADGNVEAGFKAQVAIGENADQLAVLGDGHAGDLVLAHDLERIARLWSSGDMVTGSTIMPLSERFTLSTSLACCSMVRLR